MTPDRRDRPSEARAGDGPGRGRTDPASPSRRCLLAAVATGAAGLAGCEAVPGTGTTEPEPAKVIHGVTGPQGSDAVDSLAALFAERHPDVPVEFRAVADNYDLAVENRLGTEHAPAGFVEWPGASLEPFAGDLRDVGHVWTEEGFADAMVDVAGEACRLDGAFVAVPLYAFRVNTLAYNRTVVADAGVDPASLSSVADLDDALAAIAERTDATPLAHSQADPWPTLGLWAQVLLAERGPDGYRAFVDGEADRETVVETLSLTRDLLVEYGPDDPRERNFVGMADRVAAGEAATIQMGSWVLRDFLEADAERTDDRTGGDRNWDWVALPGTGEQFVASIQALVVPAGSRRPAAADALVAFAGATDAQVEVATPDRGAVPLRTDIDREDLPPVSGAVWEQLVAAEDRLPSLTYGLALDPDRRSACLDAVAEHVSEPYDVEAATDALLDAVAGE